jgi:DNA-binding CsgD family transcriptional regulator/tetratricopeptide (TPR) repeat protein
MLGLSSPQLVGREIEIDRLVDALGGAAASRPAVILIIGAAGVGKTRLAREAIRRLADDGMLVLRGDCVQLSGGEFPYAPLAAALRDVEPEALDEAFARLPSRASAELARVFPDVITDPGTTQASDEQPQTRVFAWLLSLLRQLAETAPVALAIDDLQLADASSRDFIQFLVHNLRADRIAVVATLRSDELHRDHPARRLVADIIASEYVSRLDLAPLPIDAVERQVAAILGADPSTELVARVFARAEGNPFYTEELLAADEAGLSHLPPTLLDALLLRIESRSDQARAAARLVSVVGRPAEHALLATAAELGSQDLESALRECVDHQLLVCERDTGAYRFRHALLREAAYGDLLPSEAAALHRKIALALEEAKGAVSAAECAFHWDAAEDAERALRWLIIAGSAAQRVFAHGEALAHFTRALEIWSSAGSVEKTSVDLVDLRAAAAEAARWTGNFALAKGFCEQALEELDGHDPTRAAALYERLGRYQPWNVEGSLEAYEHALALLPGSARADRIRLQVNQAYALTFLGRWTEAKAQAEEVVDEAARAGLLPEEGSARAVLGVAEAFLGDLGGGERQLRSALEILKRTENVQDLAQIHLDLGEVLRLQGRVRDALEVMRQGERLAARHGADGSYGTFMAVNAADDLFRLGQWDAAAGRVAELERRQLGPTAELLLESVAGRLDTARGRFASASAHLARAVALTDEAALLEFIPTLRAACAELELWQGAVDAARAHVAAGLQDIGESSDVLHLPALFAMGARVEADVAQVARSRGDVEEAKEAARAAAAHGERLAHLLEEAGHRQVAPPEAAAHLAGCGAEYSRATGDLAPDAWAAAVEAWLPLDRPYAVAYAAYRGAEALAARRGPRAPAQASLSQAARLADELGAAPLQKRIQALARAARMDWPPEDAAPNDPVEPSAETGPFSDLTERERQVLALMAAGLTNREIARELFISQKTAGVHVSHILAKLRVPNRVMAAAAAHRLGLAEPRGDRLR